MIFIIIIVHLKLNLEFEKHYEIHYLLGTVQMLLLSIFVLKFEIGKSFFILK